MALFCGHENVGNTYTLCIKHILYWSIHFISKICFQFNNIEALEKAKSNVERFYSVVGITEDMSKTIKVLEDKMPEMFKGAIAEYFNNTLVKAHRHKNPYKLPVSPKVKDMLVDKFRHEIDFYLFCKQRLENQYQRLV